MLKNDDEVEINRLSADPNYRGLGIASKLIDAVEKVGAQLNCSYIKAETSSAQGPAIRFYLRNSWSEVSISLLCDR